MDLSINMGIAKQFKDADFEGQSRPCGRGLPQARQDTGNSHADIGLFGAVARAKGYSVFVVGSDSVGLAKMLVDLRAKCAEHKG